MNEPQAPAAATPEAFHKSRPTAAWPYRCFVLQAGAEGSWRALNCLEFVGEDLPRKFIWTKREDREGLRTYIDLITAGRRSESMDFEERGLVKNIEFDPEPLQGTLKVNFERFMDLLAHRGHIDLPLKYKIQFVGARGKQLVPAEFIACLMKYAPNPDWFGNPADWHWMTRDQLDEMDPGGLTISSGMYRGMENMVDTAEDVVAMEADGEQPAPSVRRYRRRPSKPPKEVEVDRRAFERYFELLTVATPSHGPQYFVRRLSTYAGEMLWSGTSFSPAGPWTEHTRNGAMLLALGVTP